MPSRVGPRHVGQSEAGSIAAEAVFTPVTAVMPMQIAVENKCERRRRPGVWSRREICVVVGVHACSLRGSTGGVSDCLWNKGGGVRLSFRAERLHGCGGNGSRFSNSFTASLGTLSSIETECARCESRCSECECHGSVSRRS